MTSQIIHTKPHHHDSPDKTTSSLKSHNGITKVQRLQQMTFSGLPALTKEEFVGRVGLLLMFHLSEMPTKTRKISPKDSLA